MGNIVILHTHTYIYTYTLYFDMTTYLYTCIVMYLYRYAMVYIYNSLRYWSRFWLDLVQLPGTTGAGFRNHPPYVCICVSMDIDDIFVKNRNSDDDHRKYCSSKINGKTSNNVLYELFRHFFADTHIYKHTYNIYIYIYTHGDVYVYIYMYICM